MGETELERLEKAIQRAKEARTAAIAEYDDASFKLKAANKRYDEALEAWDAYRKQSA